MKEGEPTIAIFGLMVRASVWLAARWLTLWVKPPLTIWGWLWTRPLRLRIRIGLAIAPWAAWGLLVAAPEALVGHVAAAQQPVAPATRVLSQYLAPLVRAERAALATAAEVLKSFARHRRPIGGSALGLLTRSVLFLVIVGTGIPLLISTVMGGPLWIAVFIWKRDRQSFGTISGRAMRPPSFRLFPRWRRRADRARTWFAGASGSGGGPLLVDTDARLTHTWVVGATGTGKTQSVLLPMLRSDILAGRPVVFIDGKGDRETLSAVWALAQEARRGADFRYLDLRRPAESCTFSPLLHGTANEQMDKIMAALRWDNEYYRSQSQSVLLRVLRSLKATGQPYSLDDVLAALSSLDAFRALATLVPERQRAAELDPIVHRWKPYQVETAGMRAQLETLLLTDFGDLVTAPQPTLDLADAYRSRSIVYLALPVARFPETAPLVAKLVIGDLNSVAAMVQDGELPKGVASIVIDEFAAFAMPLFIDLLNKARSAGMAITISHQSMRGDLVRAGDGYVSQIADNTNVKICLRQSEDAEYFAGLGGTRPIVKRTEQTQASLLGEERTGLGSARAADEYHVSPNVVRQLPQGVAVVKIDQPRQYLDLVVLDFLPSAGLPPYEPLPQERPPRSGLDLRARAPAQPLDRNAVDPNADVVLMFEGA